MQLFVVGMHRSGTSGITRVLNMAGAYFGPEGMSNGADEGNPKGFWERLDVRAMCDGFLQDSGFDWWKVADFSIEAIPEEVRAEHLTTWNKLLLEIDAHRPWVIKEPRVSLLFPLLRPSLEVPICIHVTREPLEVAGSLRTRNEIPTHAGLALWERYTIDAFASTAGLPRIHVRYEDLMAAPTEAVPALIDQLTDLGAYGLRVPSDKEITSFITPKLHRQHRSAAERSAWMNEQQLSLATAIDEGTILDIEIPTEISPSALAVLRELESDWGQKAEMEAKQAETDAEVQDLQDRLDAETVAFGERVEELEAKTDRFQARADDAEQRAARSDTRSEEALKKAARHEAAHRSELERRQRVEQLALEGLRSAEQRLDATARSRTWKMAWRAASMRQTLTPGVKRRRGPVDSALRTVRHTRSQIEKAGDDSKEPPPAGSPASHPRTLPAAPVRHRSEPSPATEGDDGRSRPKVAVMSWDVGHNPLGRAHVLASILSRRFDVEIWGAQFPRYGTDVWEPLRHGDIPVHSFPGLDLPDHLDSMAEVASQIDADAVYVSKPRFPSYALGALAKQARNRPLVLDVDDHELSFFDEERGLTVDQLRDLGDEDDLRLAFGKRWTQACEPLIDAADHLTVSNVALQDRFGGTIVPHARDERIFDPARYDPAETRRSLGIPSRERLLLFGGTPRRHKGIVEVLQALDRLGDDRYRVLIFGTREFNTLRKEIGSLSRWVRALPPLDFADLPRVVGAADLACVLQDPTHPISRYQLPAKLTDALAMGVPTLVRPVPPLRPMVDKGALQVLGEGERLHQRIAEIFEDHDAALEVAAHGRRLFLEAYSYEAVGHTVNPVFEKLIEGTTDGLHPGLTELIEAPREIVATVDSASSGAEVSRKTARPVRVPGRRLAHVPDGAQYDVVMIWKQNDSGIYGRRSDMMLEYLSRSDRVHTVVHFDRPITPEELRRTWRSANPTIDQRRQIVRQTVRRALHRADGRRVHNRTFVYGGKHTRRLGLPARRDFPEHVKASLERHGFGSRPIVLVTYPTNHHLPAIIDTLDPEIVVTDVVDDHRTFCEPGTERYEEFESNYREVLSRSDVVIANCEEVASGMRGFAPQVHVIPNGCELTNGRRSAEVPEELRHVRGPIIGYVGNLSQRLDLPLLEALVGDHPEWNFVFVGSAHYDRSILDLDHLPNVTFTGPKRYDETVRLVQHFDVALIPHVDDRMTRSMNPLKAFVYVSTGVPVVSTPIANLDELGDLIRIARGPDGFAEAITEALQQGRREPDLDRLALISWPARVERLIELIDEAAAAARSA